MKFSFLLGVSILLVSCATNADIGSAMKQLKEDGVNPAQATCSPSSPINDALPIFQTFRGELTGLNADTMPKERTTNCLPAILLTLKNPGQIKEIKLINSFAGIYALRKDHGVQACAKGDIGCCGNIDNSYVQCVRDLDINPGTSPVMKKFALLPTMQALMHEVGISSFVVPAADLKTVKFVGDEIYFLWPIAIRTDAAPVNYLFTKVDSELVQRLVVAVNELAPTFRAISNSGYPGASSYICNYDGILPRPYLKLPDNIRLKVGTGQSTNIRRVTGVDYNKSLLINVLKSDSRDISALEVDEGVEPVLGGDNRNLFEFANALTQKGLAPFTCYGKALSDVFNDPTSLRFFNSYSASVFYFGLIYLNGFANEFMVAPAVASVKEEVIDLKEAEKSILLASGEAAKLVLPENLKLASKATSPALNCPLLCEQGNPKCLLMELADEQRYKGLKGLYADSMGVRPHVITQARLKELFGEHASSKERTDIHLTDTSVLNSGSIPVYISLQVNNLFQVRMDFPVFIEGDVEKFDGHEMNLIFRDEGKSPRITFSDEIFNNRYGGVLRSVAVESSNTYFETSNGCLQLPYQKSTKAEFDLRTARVSKDVLGIDVSKLLDLRATSVSCSVGTGGAPDGTCSCKSCASLLCCSDPHGDPNSPGVCCEVSSWSPDANGNCNYQNHAECGCM